MLTWPEKAAFAGLGMGGRTPEILPLGKADLAASFRREVVDL